MKILKMSLLVVFLLAAVNIAAAAVNCYDTDHSANQAGCEADFDCTWLSDEYGSWCEDRRCQSLWSEENCTNSMALVNLSCGWMEMATGWCEPMNCFQFGGTDNATCEGNFYSLNCEWDNRCMLRGTDTGQDCWSKADSASCGNTTGCQWGDCYEKGCWSATSSATCTVLIGANNQACRWNAVDYYCYEPSCWDYTNQTSCEANTTCTWESGVCSDPWCSDWDYVNQSSCENNTANLSCDWSPSDQRCNELGCWVYPTEAQCDAANQTGGSICSWRTDTGGWCEEKACWLYDDISMGGLSNESYCEAQNGRDNINCTWDAEYGWCFENFAAEGWFTDTEGTFNCSKLTNEWDCMDTFYCWWNFSGETCNSPTGDEDIFFSEWNPGCYIFDQDSDACKNTTVCTWTGTVCNDDFTKTDGQLNCSAINNSNLCGNIGALSSCCNWYNGSCVPNRGDQSCREEMNATPEGAAYCEDYKAYDNFLLCTQIAGGPWYMPCAWNNNTQHCEFNSKKVFGAAGEGGFSDIDNEKNCEAAGGKWVKEPYCDGARKVPSGRCEHKFDSEVGACDRKCFSCEFKKDGSNWSSVEEARSACENSKAGVPPGSPDDAVGWCNFSAYAAQSTSTGRYGECRQKAEAKKMGGQSCDVDCSSCTYMGKISEGKPQMACKNSAANCKWFTDPLKPSDGWCGPASDKSCADYCDRCYSQSACTDSGGGGNGSCKWDTATLVCTPSAGADSMEICWDGTDNDGNNKIDCSDSKCYSDPFCGGAAMFGDFGVDCFQFTDNATCEDNNCSWINETWSQWCDMPSSKCWSNDGTDNETCEGELDRDGNPICEWHNGSGGHCDINKTLAETCFWKTMDDCNSSAECAWIIDPWCTGGGGYLCKGPEQNGCWDLMTNSTCSAVSGCTWEQDSFCDGGGGMCDFVGFSCWQHTNLIACNASSYCRWQVDDWSPDGGWCEGKCFDPSLNQANCLITNLTNVSTGNCTWSGGFCDPVGFGGDMMMGGGGMGGSNCFMYQGDEDTCNSQTGCKYFSEANAFCDVNTSSNCPQYSGDEGVCNNQANCKWNDQGGSIGFCDEKPFECFWNNSLKNNASLCNDNQYCNWSSYGCEPTCFNSTYIDQAQGSCAGNGTNYGCQWLGGWCEPEMGADMFMHMEKGAPIMLGWDACGTEGIASENDICGFGMKDVKDGWTFGINVNSMGDAAICNGYKLGGFGAGADTGKGQNATKFYWYLDTDGTSTGGCAARDDANMAGFEFHFKYEAGWDTAMGQANESYTAYKCVSGEWGSADIRLSTMKQFMCSDITGGMIMVDKGELNKYQSLFIPGNDFRIYVTTANSTGSVTVPTDVVSSAGYATPEAIDFKPECCWDPGADCDEDNITAQNDADCDDMKLGYVVYEDCFTSTDEDNDGVAGCNDPDCVCETSDCSDLPHCADTGVNAAGYSDTTAPVLKSIRVEKYTDSALVLYDTSEPANGTLLFHNQSATCEDLTSTINDSGITYSNVRSYKVWHDAEIYSANGAPLALNTTYYYKIQVCDKSRNCGTSACLSFKTPATNADCAFCNFTTRIGVPTGWTVSYDLDQDGDYEHVQGSMCGTDAGMKTDYLTGRRVNVFMNTSATGPWIKFLNTRLTKSGLNWKVRQVDESGFSNGTSDGISYAGLPRETRDKIVNNLHPETCQVKIAGQSSQLWHCSEDLATCNQITNAVNLYLNETNNVSTGYRVWNVPYCEFSVWSSGDLTSDDGDGTTTTDGGSGGGGGGGVVTGVREIFTYDQIIPGEGVEITTVDESLLFEEISFDVAEELADTQVTVSRELEKPEDTPEDVPAEVFGYMQIKLTNIPEESLESPKIVFKVNKSWIKDNNILKNSIKLYRYESGDWAAQPTKKLVETSDDYITYEATPAGFSYFAIGGEKPAVEEEVAEEELSEEEKAAEEAAKEAEAAAEEAVWKSEYTIAIVILAVIVIIVIVAVALSRKKEVPVKKKKK